MGGVLPCGAQGAELIVAPDQQAEAVQTNNDGPVLGIELQRLDPLLDKLCLQATRGEALASAFEHGRRAIDARDVEAGRGQWREKSAAAARQLEHRTAESSSEGHMDVYVGEIAVVLPVVQPCEAVERVARPAQRRIGSSTEPRVPNSTPSSTAAYRPINNNTTMGVSVRNAWSHRPNNTMTANSIEWAR